MDAKSKLPLPYVNIGIIDQPVGTLSNADGTFSLSIPVSYQSDSLLFTSLGYSPQKISIRSLTENSLIFLQQRAIQLQEVRVVADKNVKVYDLGNKLSDNSFTCSDSASAGAAMALLIDNKFPHFHRKLTTPYLLQKAAILIGTNTLSEFKLRLRLLEYDSLTGLPGQDLFDKNIIITSRLQREGWIDIDLSNYGIRIDQPRFFLAFEWILDDNDRRWVLNQYKEFAIANPQRVKIDTIVVEGKKIPHVNWRGISVGTSFRVSTLPYSLKNYQCFYRTNSQGAWIRSSFILTARLFASNG
ncbi:carboxypeptidase-like regulatory domain-containing protein [Spirosoma validum]|uniref:Carboxypeptidase-like regulatory domain-containing protein n=1 Tax=Spirosoma validum TaxID=2771355 RepID=A0A927B6P8_9BACT|nr:carboxypeptidase-like regulatory domain-containing protein [Spirosoma validum]MBD2756211.1 carboxypeptidase-like regulatory domain-containing protein [Spirosoma validum]